MCKKGLIGWIGLIGWMGLIGFLLDRFNGLNWWNGF